MDFYFILWIRISTSIVAQIVSVLATGSPLEFASVSFQQVFCCSFQPFLTLWPRKMLQAYRIFFLPRPEITHISK